ncbi:mucin TcMUCII [Trypanosoma cruzi]|nr:mucin TcMUCII [Trypanosoma cruzi]
MMTCRLLCALLVLALCCCPSVCMTASDGHKSTELITSSSQSQVQGGLDKGQESVKGPGVEPENGRSAEEGLGSEGISLPTKAVAAISGQTTGASVLPGTPIPASDNPESPGLANQSAQTQEVLQTGNVRSGEELSQSQESTLPRAPEKSVEAPTTTTTTTTAAPATTSTTTSTTTTEAPTYDDHPCTVTSSRNRRQPQQLCVGVCPAASCRIRAGVHRCGLKRCVWAVRASTQPRGSVYVYCGPMYKARVIIMIVFCFSCFCCLAVCSTLLPTSVTLNASQTHSYARHAYCCLCGRIVENRCMRTGATWVQFFVFCFYCFTLLLLVYLCSVFPCCVFFFFL